MIGTIDAALGDCDSSGPMPLGKMRWSDTWQCAIASLRQRHVWPMLALAALIIVGLILRNMWWLVGTCFRSCFKYMTCGQCSNADVIEFHPPYLKALESGRLRGLADYNIFTNPVYQSAFNIDENYHYNHAHLQSMHSLGNFQYADVSDGHIPAPPPHPSTTGNARAARGGVGAGGGADGAAAAVVAPAGADHASLVSVQVQGNVRPGGQPGDPSQASAPPLPPQPLPAVPPAVHRTSIEERSRMNAGRASQVL